MALAKALGVTEKKAGYIEGNGYIVSWCVGHLVSLANADMYDEKFKKWDIADLPIIPDEWQFIIAEDKNKQFGILRQLMDDSRITEVVNACDAGREGELRIMIPIDDDLMHDNDYEDAWKSQMEAMQNGTICTEYSPDRGDPNEVMNKLAENAYSLVDILMEYD